MDNLSESPAPVFTTRRWVPLQHHPGHVCIDPQQRGLEEHCVLWSLHLTVVTYYAISPEIAFRIRSVNTVVVMLVFLLNL